MKPTYVLSRKGVVMACMCLLLGCTQNQIQASQTTDQRYLYASNALQLELNQTTKDDVSANLGEPSYIDTDGNGNLFYSYFDEKVDSVSTTVRNIVALPFTILLGGIPPVHEHFAHLAVTFSDDGTVISYIYSDLDNSFRSFVDGDGSIKRYYTNFKPESNSSNWEPDPNPIFK